MVTFASLLVCVLLSLPLSLEMHLKIIYPVPRQVCQEEEQLNSTGFEAYILFTDLGYEPLESSFTAITKRSGEEAKRATATVLVNLTPI